MNRMLSFGVHKSIIKNLEDQLATAKGEIIKAESKLHALISKQEELAEAIQGYQEELAEAIQGYQLDRISLDAQIDLLTLVPPPLKPPPPHWPNPSEPERSSRHKKITLKSQKATMQAAIKELLAALEVAELWINNDDPAAALDKIRLHNAREMADIALDI